FGIETDILGNAENPDEVSCGDHTEKSPYEFQMRVPQMCNVVCRIVLTEKTTKEFKEKIDDEYKFNMEHGLVVRSHEVKDEGYEIDQDSKLIAVFFAPNYYD
ncbi:transmembrane 9 superfamily member 8-like protein, partial [Tanacetum coccineum]